MFRKLFQFATDTASVALDHSSEAAMSAFAAALPGITSEAGIKRAEAMVEQQRLVFIDSNKALEAELDNDDSYRVPYEKALKALKALKAKIEDPSVSEEEKSEARATAELIRPDFDKKKEAYEADQLRNQRAQERQNRAKTIYDRMKTDLRVKREQLAENSGKIAESKDRKTLADMDLAEERALHGMSATFDATNVAFAAMSRAADKADSEAQAAEMRVREAREESVSSADAAIAKVLGEVPPKVKDPFDGL